MPRLIGGLFPVTTDMLSVRSVIPVLLAAASLTACDRVKTALNPPQVDPVWRNDSTIIAAKPTVLFRVDRSTTTPRIIPIATVGERGIKSLRLSSRGWRAFDLDYLHSGAYFVPYRYGTPLAAVSSSRGMWEGATVLDSLSCPSPIPAAMVSLASDIDLLTSGVTPIRASIANGLSEGELQQVLSTVNTLTAPTAGISLSQLARYRRSVHMVATGVSSQPTIVVSYDDPEELPDSATRITARPHHYTVVLDKGIYGYKPSYTFTDVSISRIQPRRKFLGALDINGDGKAELLFGLQETQYPLVTYVYRFEGDTWIEEYKFERGRCG